MVAIIETGGKQYCVQLGQKVEVERINAQVGDTVTFTNLLDGTSVAAEVLGHKFGDKVVIRKFRNKTRSHKMKGHRQPLSLITLKGDAPAKAAAKKTDKTAEEA